MKNLLKELNKMDKMSFLLIKIFSLVSVAVMLAGYIFTIILKNTEVGRHLLTMSAGLVAEGIWAGVILDCIKRRD